MDLSTFATDPAQLSGFVDGLSWEPWKRLSGDASAITIATVTSSNVLLLKGKNLVRLAYPLRDTYAKNGKIRGTFAVSLTLAQQIVKLEQPSRPDHPRE